MDGSTEPELTVQLRDTNLTEMCFSFIYYVMTRSLHQFLPV